MNWNYNVPKYKCDNFDDRRIEQQNRKNLNLRINTYIRGETHKYGISYAP